MDTGGLDMTWFSSDSDSDEEQKIQRKPRNFRRRINFSRSNDLRFKEKFRLSNSACDFVLGSIGKHLLHDTNRNFALTPDQQFLIALAWMGNGSQYHAIGRMHGVDKSTVQRCVMKVSRIIVQELFGEIVRWPDGDNSSIGQKFEQLSTIPFPNVAGLIDGSLIPIDAPSIHEESFVDRKGHHSINVLAVCGPRHEFFFLSAKWPGSVHDARMQRNSNLTEKWDSGYRPFPNAIILGDSGFKLTEWLIPPITSGPPSNSSRRFLRAHKSTRRIIENSFSIWKEMFPCLNHLRLEPEPAAIVIMATAVLHNVQKKFSNVELEAENVELANLEENEEDEHLEEEEVAPSALENLSRIIASF